jgi:hypothetical protein
MSGLQVNNMFGLQARRHTPPWHACRAYVPNSQLPVQQACKASCTAAAAADVTCMHTTCPSGRPPTSSSSTNHWRSLKRMTSRRGMRTSGSGLQGSCTAGETIRQKGHQGAVCCSAARHSMSLSGIAGGCSIPLCRRHWHGCKSVGQHKQSWAL